jgi:hypothetical protein
VPPDPGSGSPDPGSPDPDPDPGSGSPDPSSPPTAVTSASFSVPAETVWRYRLDFSNLPEYNPDVSDVTRTGDGDPGGVGGVLGPGARYSFQLADARAPGGSQGVELWLVDAVEPTLVSAGMAGGHEAYEEFVVRPGDGGEGCEATLTLWVALPSDLPDDVRAAAATGSLEQIAKELRLMKDILEAR